MSQHSYVVSVFKDDDFKSFNSLEDLKWNLDVCLTSHEAKKYLRNKVVLHYIGETFHSYIPIYVSEYGEISFGQVHLAIPF